MLRNVRHGVFETNSSSMHSLSMGGSAVGGNTAGFVPGGKYVAAFGEFGWEYDQLRSAAEKLSYALTSLQYLDPTVSFQDAAFKFIGEDAALAVLEGSRYFRWIRDMVKDYTGATLVVEFSGGDWYPAGYIDHQSAFLLEEEGLWSGDEETFKSNMRDLVFGSAVITTDNDNH